MRPQKIGDKILLNGHYRKLKRIYHDLKTPILERENAIIVEQSDKILAIFGIAVSDLSKCLKNDTIKGRLYLKKIK